MLSIHCCRHYRDGHGPVQLPRPHEILQHNRVGPYNSCWNTARGKQTRASTPPTLLDTDWTQHALSVPLGEQGDQRDELRGHPALGPRVDDKVLRVLPEKRQKAEPRPALRLRRRPVVLCQVLPDPAGVPHIAELLKKLQAIRHGYTVVWKWQQVQQLEVTRNLVRRASRSIFGRKT